MIRTNAGLIRCTSVHTKKVIIVVAVFPVSFWINNDKDYTLSHYDCDPRIFSGEFLPRLPFRQPTSEETEEHPFAAKWMAKTALKKHYFSTIFKANTERNEE